MNKGTAVVGFILCFLAGVGLMWGVDRGGGGSHSVAAEHGQAKGIYPQGPWSDEAASIPVSSKDPSWGARTAPVTIVIFSDFQCPYCKDNELGTMQTLKEKYGPEKLRLVWKNNPLPMHSKAMPAHVAAQAVFRLAGSEAFWAFNERAFENNRDLSPDNFEVWAAEAGVDAAKFKAAMADNAADRQKVQEDLDLGRRSGVSGTPAFFVNGVFINGNQSVGTFSQEIDRQLKAAEQALAAGTKADELYVKLTNQNKPRDPSAASAQPQPQPPPPKEPPKKPEQDTKTVWKIVPPAGAASRLAGPEPFKKADALVTIVELSDFECPQCGKVAPTVKKILETEKYAGKVRLVWLDNPIPRRPGESAASFALEAMAQKGAPGFWAAHDLLFSKQAALGAAELDKYAAELGDVEVTVDGKKQKLGTDAAKLKDAVQKRRHGDRIYAGQVVADDFQAVGIPQFFINGRRIAGAEELETFTKVIDEELVRAEALLKKDVKPADLYKELVKDGKEPPAFASTLEKKDVGPAPKDAPTKGGDKATVVIQQFSEFEDPYCARAAGVMTQLVETYGDKIKVVWRHRPLPVHKNAVPAAIAAQAVYEQKGSKGFWALHDVLFQNQKALDADAIKKAVSELTLDGKPAGLDLAKWSAAIASDALKKRVEADGEAATKAQIGGAPVFVVNGYYVSGPQSFVRFRRVVDLALKEAAKP
ncbi:MAG: thioredoxin domain-containing protein [Myxococcales bacterium]|nr:thioredoxin domain-containing protein [Myxococcales bacterium]